MECGVCFRSFGQCADCTVCNKSVYVVRYEPIYTRSTAASFVLEDNILSHSLIEIALSVCFLAQCFTEFNFTVPSLQQQKSLEKSTLAKECTVVSAITTVCNGYVLNRSFKKFRQNLIHFYRNNLKDRHFFCGPKVLPISTQKSK